MSAPVLAGAWIVTISAVYSAKSTVISGLMHFRGQVGV
jgi:hypothetical protein